MRLYSPGKLLLTSEYFVLDGALALALPTKLGQDFFCEEIEDHQSIIFWNAYYNNKPWLSIVINYRTWNIISCSNEESAKFIISVLQNVQDLGTQKFHQETSYKITTNLEFHPHFGLGSSSTLMANLAEWASVDAFILNEVSLGGSGYDIAVAKEKSALLYQNYPEKKVTKVNFTPKFKNDLAFVYLNNKQNSREGISLYKSKQKSINLIDEFSELTNKIYTADNLEDFIQLMQYHELLISQFLGIETAKNKFFKEYNGLVKSLGAWGGDFVLISKFGEYQNYLKESDLICFFEWDDLII